MNKTTRSVLVVGATGAVALLAFNLAQTNVVLPPTSQIIIEKIDSDNFHVSFPQSINTSNYEWYIQSTTNLALPFEFEYAVRTSNGFDFQRGGRNPFYFRLVGVPL